MKKILEQAIKKEIEKEVLEAISEVDISYYLQPKTIKAWVEGVIKTQIAEKVRDVVELKIIKEVRKHQPLLDSEIERLVFEEVGKHMKL